MLNPILAPDNKGKLRVILSISSAADANETIPKAYGQKSTNCPVLLCSVWRAGRPSYYNQSHALK